MTNVIKILQGPPETFKAGGTSNYDMTTLLHRAIPNPT
jgi:hypothetical protein